MKLYLLIILLATDWPQAGGPNGSWHVRSAAKPPTEWSVALNQNIVWKTALPNGGQSGIASLPGRQVEEDVPIPFGSRRLLGDGTQRSIELAVEFEALLQDLHDDAAAIVLPF